MAIQVTPTSKNVILTTKGKNTLGGASGNTSSSTVTINGKKIIVTKKTPANENSTTTTNSSNPLIDFLLKLFGIKPGGGIGIIEPKPVPKPKPILPTTNPSIIAAKALVKAALALMSKAGNNNPF